MQERKKQNVSNQNNLVVGIKGLKGGGKTLFLTLLLYLDYLNGKKIYSNYRLCFPHEIIDVEKLVKLDVELKDASIGIDEIHMICDSRRSGRKQNLLMSYFVLQSRHRSVNLYYTTQFNRQVDVRIRENTDVDVVCVNLGFDSDGDGLNDIFRVIIKDKRVIPPVVRSKVLYGKLLFSLYDTNYIVDIFNMKKVKKKWE